MFESHPETWDTGENGDLTDPWPRWDAAANTLGGAYDSAHDSKKGAIDH